MLLKSTEKTVFPKHLKLLKIKTMKKLIIFLSILALLIGCRKKAQAPCEIITCKARQFCDNGVCKCDSTSYNMGNWCSPKQWGDNLIYYSQSDCACFDTIALLVESKPGNGVGTSSNPNPLELGVTAFFPENEKGGAKGVAADYFPKPDGDSLYMTYQYGWFGCIEERLFPVAMCKFNKAKDTLRMKMLWYRITDPQKDRVLADSCNKVFVRQVR